jgi:DNA helicase-2/ATP-dependent DNA helicase PcrA
LLQEHFVAAQKEWRGLHVMTIHKAKGKEFDEVVIYEPRDESRTC